VRYAFPESGFSAVFHQRPNAMLKEDIATDGVTLTMRVLGSYDATGYSTVIACMSGPQPLTSDDARTLIDDAKATEIREVEIGGRRGFEGVVSGSNSRGVMRTVDLDRGVCRIAAEYPPHLAASYEQQARAFLDSFQLGGFEG
jgi:hypothetical protein